MAEQAQQRWREWVVEASTAAGIDPDLVDIAELHHLSRQVAHRLERPLAPISTFILGLALGSDRAEDTRSRADLVASILATLPPEDSS